MSIVLILIKFGLTLHAMTVSILPSRDILDNLERSMYLDKKLTSMLLVKALCHFPLQYPRVTLGTTTPVERMAVCCVVLRNFDEIWAYFKGAAPA